MRDRYPNAICRPIAVQFVEENSVAVLELAVREEDDILKLNIVEERQYLLFLDQKSLREI